MDSFFLAVSQTINPYALVMLMFGVIGGIVVGAIPGMTANMAVAIMTSLSFGMDSMVAIMLLIGVYFGSMYGGSISAILLHIPGTPSAVMTAKDGYPMGQRGEAGRAIGIATFASFSGGMISMVFLMLAAPILSKMALRFSAPEYFALACFGLSIVASLDSNSLARGVVSALLGVMLCMIGMDPITGIQRFTFGIPEFSDGIGFIPVMIGLFGMAEIFKQLASTSTGWVPQKLTGVLPSWVQIKQLASTIFRSALIGTGIGALPGAGGSIACFVAYDHIKKRSKHPEKFGTGIPEGIAAPESANNAVTGGALMPLLTLGVPGDSVTAIMLGAFILHKITPGAMLFVEQPHVVYGIYISGILANVFMAIVGFSSAGLFARLISFPKYVLLPVILLLCVVGSFAVHNSMFDVYVMLVFGLVGYILSKLDMPLTPLILGVVLGPILEENLRLTITMSNNNFFYYFCTRPIAMFFMLVTILCVVLPTAIRNIKLRSKDKQGQTTE